MVVDCFGASVVAVHFVADGSQVGLVFVQVGLNVENEYVEIVDVKVVENVQFALGWLLNI